MKQKIFTLTIIILSTLSLFSQNPKWEWAKSAGSDKPDVGLCVVTDKIGNVYVSGGFGSASIAFGSYTLNNATIGQGNDIFLVKYDRDGNVIWAKNYGSINSEDGRQIAIDKNGDIYIAGHFGISTELGSFVLTGISLRDMFIMKLDSSGNVLWANSAVGDYEDYCNNLTLDDSDNVYVSGYFSSSSLTMGSTTLLNTKAGANYNAEIYILKYNSSGDLQWAIKEGEFGNEKLLGLCIDKKGYIYMVGWFSRYISPKLTIGKDTIINKGSSDFLLIKHDPAGKVIWAKGDGGRGADEFIGTTCDNAGNLYITGRYNSKTITLGKFSLTNPDSGIYQYITAKYDTSGNALWVKTVVPQHAKRYAEPSDIISDHLANVYVTGLYMDSSITFNDKKLENKTGSGIFVVKYDSSGNALWVKGASAYMSYGIALDNNKDLLITGSFGLSKVFFDDDSIIKAPGSFDIFVAKMSQCNIVLPIISVVSKNLVSTDAATYQWFFNGNTINGATSKSYTPKQNGIYTVLITDSYGCSATSLPFNYQGVGINEENEDVKIALFPNPTTGKFTIILPEETRNIVILNSSGQIVLTQDHFAKTISEFELNENGMYYIRISTKDKIYTRKLVVYAQ